MLKYPGRLPVKERNLKMSARVSQRPTEGNNWKKRTECLGHLCSSFLYFMYHLYLISFMYRFYTFVPVETPTPIMFIIMLRTNFWSLVPLSIPSCMPGDFQSSAARFIRGLEDGWSRTQERGITKTHSVRKRQLQVLTPSFPRNGLAHRIESMWLSGGENRSVKFEARTSNTHGDSEHFLYLTLMTRRKNFFFLENSYSGLRYGRSELSLQEISWSFALLETACMRNYTSFVWRVIRILRENAVDVSQPKIDIMTILCDIFLILIFTQ